MNLIDSVHSTTTQSFDERSVMTKSYQHAAALARIAAMAQHVARRTREFSMLLRKALHETRRREAARVIADHAHLIGPTITTLPLGGTSSCAEASAPFAKSGRCQEDDDADFAMRMICPITSFPCEGDDVPLCEDYGCARKGGLLPVSDGFY